MRAKERAAEGYKAAMKDLDAKEDRLFDRFDSNERSPAHPAVRR